MSRERRRELIKEIEEARQSRVVAYVTSDRPPVQAAMGDDAVRPISDHLRQLDHVPRLDLYIYSRGGAIDVPWRLARAFRQVSDEWNILIPFRANSAATLLALGADHIILGKQGELGPIDPTMTISRMQGDPSQQGTLVQDTISVEDVMAYVKFVRERAGLSDQEALATGLGKLVDRIDAVTLGNLYRTYSHIRDVARRMLLSRHEPPNEQVTSTIIETLAERVYAHGHAIGVDEAQAIGLTVDRPEPPLETMMWQLLNEYESDLRLLEPLDVLQVLTGVDRYSENATIAVVESTWASHEFGGEVEVVAKRQLPPTLNISFNLNLQLPAGVEQAPLQELLAQLQQAVGVQAQAAVQQALQQQAPLVGAEARMKGGAWRLHEPVPDGPTDPDLDEGGGASASQAQV